MTDGWGSQMRKTFLFAAVVVAVVIAGTVIALHRLPTDRSPSSSVHTSGTRFSGTAPQAVIPGSSSPGPTEGARAHNPADHAPVRPIRHVVLIFLENHSFDNVLGLLCVRYHRCNGVSTGKLADGRRIKLKRASDVVPDVYHEPITQERAMNHGRMNGFSKIDGCSPNTWPAYRCYSQFRRWQIPNLWRLARHFAISDATFSDGPIPSFGSHLDLVAQTLDGFTGATPLLRKGDGPGVGCDSHRVAQWRAGPGRPARLEPSCVPWYALRRRPYGGAYLPTRVRHVPTLMDRMSRAKVSWKIYETTSTLADSRAAGYGWAICPTFADCFYSSQRRHMTPSNQVISDARRGALPAVSLVMPAGKNSQHNSFSMSQGDAWLGHVVSAIEQGPDWPHTTVFITYDDCGCFYDHVRPPHGLGIRVPMVLVGPYVRRHFTDHTTASFSSIDHYIETTFGLRPLTSADANAYGYRKSFDYTQTPARPVGMVQTRVPAASLERIAAHPPKPEMT